MALPNFLIIGAAKAGTTTVYHHLSRHPQVFMPAVKEPAFFAYEGEDPYILRRTPVNDITQHYRHDPVTTTFADYRRLFEGVTREIAIGEASPHYLENEHAPQRIRHYLPDARLIAILRHPVDAAHSNYVMRRRDGRETATTFAAAVEQGREQSRQIDRFYGIPRYNICLKRYLGLFAPGQIRIFLYDDLVRAPDALIAEVCRFIGVSDDLAADLTERKNTGGVHRSALVGAVFNRPNPLRYAARRMLSPTLRVRLRERLLALSLRPPSRLEPDLRQAFTEELRDDILELQNLIGRDLSHWLAPPH